MQQARKPRTRRTAEHARALFLSCAETLLIEGGLSAVQMRSVARAAEVTDAAIAHHFGNRDGLLSALMDQVVAKVRQGISEITKTWAKAPSSLIDLITELDQLYAQGYAELAHAVTHSGWRDQGSPLLKPVIDALIRQNKNAKTSAGDLRRVVAALHMDLALSPLYGDAFRRSVGLRSNRERARHLDWWASRIEEMLNTG